MADKPRTPPPPRQQGPRQRTAKTPGARGQRGALLAGVLVGGLIVLAALVFFLTRSTKKSEPANGGIAAPTAQMKAAGCTLKSVAPLPPTHGDHPSAYHEDSPSLDSKVKWSTDPPSAGGHYQSPAIWDFYTDPVNPRQVVHNEEHGGLIIWYGDKVPAATLAQIRAFYNEDPLSILVTPYAGLGDKIALTAWTGDPSTYYVNADYGMGHIAVCPKYDATAFRAFRDAYRGKGPEGVPMDANTPGS